MQPVVSVIIPFLCREDISGRCLKSVQGQTFREIQIICVCGEDFEDSNGQYLRKIAKEDPRILIVERKTEEVHNAGLSRAVGEYALLLNPEDYCEPDMLEHVVCVMQKDRADFVVFRAGLCADGNEKTTTIREKDLPPYTPFSSRSITGDVYTVFSSLLQDKLYSREFLLLKKLEFDKRSADAVQDFVQKALLAARRITYMEDVLVHTGRDVVDQRPAEDRPVEISVVIPVHNAERYIGQCLDSVLENRDTETEIICVDDCSTDSTPEILKGYAEKYKNIVVLHNETNMYAGASRNRGLLAARGKYVHFLDSDDIVIPGAYRKLYDISEENDLDWIKTTARAFSEEDGTEVRNPRYEMKPLDHGYDGKLLDFKNSPSVFLMGMSLVPWNAIYKRSFLTDNDIRFNHLYCVNDRSFFVETCVKGSRMMLARIDIVKHRTNVGTSLAAKRLEHFDCQFESYKLMKKICDENHVSERVRFRILDSEMYDMINWYLKMPEDSGLREKCRRDLHDFAVENVDFALFEKHEQDSLWLRYRELTETGEEKND